MNAPKIIFLFIGSHTPATELYLLHFICRGQVTKNVFVNVHPSGIVNKTFIVRNLQIFVRSRSVCHWQFFPA
jgi:hypothetical protein